MELLTLKKIFSDSYFRVPDYQRGYSWEERHLKALWQDIQNIDLEKDRQHYVGLLTVQKVGKEETDKWKGDLRLNGETFFVIDGQQRLTTLIILLQVLHQKAKLSEDFDKSLFMTEQGTDDAIKSKFLYEESKTTKQPSFFFGYQIDDPSYECFKTKILGTESMAAANERETVYTQNLIRAKKYFEARFTTELNRTTSPKTKLEIIKKWYDKITQGLVFSYLKIDNTSKINIHVTFETMNNRGKSLSKLELLKNRLIYLSTLLENEDHEKEQLREDINNAWKTIYTYLGKDSSKKLDDDEFLQNHWIMYFPRGSFEIGKFGEYLLDDIFIIQKIIDNKLKYEDIVKYIKSIQIAVEVWFFMHNPNHSDANLSDGERSFLERLNDLGFMSFKPLVMAALHLKHRGFTEDNHYLLHNIERYIFVFALSQSRNTDNSRHEPYTWSRDVYQYQQTISDIRLKINERTTAKLNWVAFKTFLEDGKNTNNPKKGWYKWDKLRYFLYEYEMHLRHKTGVTDKIKRSDFKENSIEHIYPQNPKNKIPFDITKRYCNSLGNLVLLSTSKNIGFSNDTFEDKRKDYATGSCSEIEVATTYEVWNHHTIKERGTKMLDFLCERYGISKLQPDEITGVLYVSSSCI